MKIRSCPHCGYQYSFSDYLKKFLFRFPGSIWLCAHCGSELTFNSGRRLWLAIISILPIVVSPLITDLLQKAGLTEGLSWVTFILFFVVISLLVYSFETFVLIHKEEKIND